VSPRAWLPLPRCRRCQELVKCGLAAPENAHLVGGAGAKGSRLERGTLRLPSAIRFPRRPLSREVQKEPERIATVGCGSQPSGALGLPTFRTPSAPNSCGFHRAPIVHVWRHVGAVTFFVGPARRGSRPGSPAANVPERFRLRAPAPDERSRDALSALAGSSAALDLGRLICGFSSASFSQRPASLRQSRCGRVRKSARTEALASDSAKYRRGGKLSSSATHICFPHCRQYFCGTLPVRVSAQM
jgi:hypothetical protein